MLVLHQQPGGQQPFLFLQQPQSLVLLQHSQGQLVMQHPLQQQNLIVPPVSTNNKIMNTPAHSRDPLSQSPQPANVALKRARKPRAPKAAAAKPPETVQPVPTLKTKPEAATDRPEPSTESKQQPMQVPNSTVKLEKTPSIVQVNTSASNESPPVLKSPPVPKQSPKKPSPSTSKKTPKKPKKATKASVESDDDDGFKDDKNDNLKDIYTRIDYGGYECSICLVTRLDRRSMLSHIAGQHSHLRPFKCDICDKTFKRKYTMSQHRLAHTLKESGELNRCKKCEYSSPSKAALGYHVYRMHTDEYRFTCEHCGKRYKVKRELVDHLVTHTNEKHMCDICGKLYRGEHLLRAHRRLHLDLYKFQCALCKKKLATQDSLDKHMQLHSRTFECNDCNMKFPCKYNLIKHRNVHTREHAFPCPHCGKVFADQPTQKVHSLIHAGLKPYRCNVCGLGFTQRTPMMLHWKKKHPGETEPPPPVILSNILKSIEDQNKRKDEENKDE